MKMQLQLAENEKEMRPFQSMVKLVYARAPCEDFLIARSIHHLQ
jgi:hypothetical protein